jgi:predicted metal-dependent hydrolase
LISEHLAEYVVVHELCHLEQLNHSQAFWDLVAITIPDYKRRRSELKKIRI